MARPSMTNAYIQSIVRVSNNSRFCSRFGERDVQLSVKSADTESADMDDLETCGKDGKQERPSPQCLICMVHETNTASLASYQVMCTCV